MQSPSKVKRESSPLFLDASVVINLVASSYMDGILIALKRPIMVTEEACAEFKRHPRDGGSSQSVMEALQNRGRVQIVKMSDPQIEVFLRLTGCPPPDDLGDGEAATLACADGVGCAVIDDRKAIRIASRDFPDQAVYSSLDLFCAEPVLHGLGRPSIAKAVYNAIKTARMRVPQHWKSWLSSLLGKARTSELPILNSPAFAAETGNRPLPVPAVNRK